MMRTVRRRTVSPCVWCAAAAMLAYIGCTPSVRYTRGGLHEPPPRGYTVPQGWDYRKHYTVPANRLSAVAATYLGTPYRFGGMKRSGTDCSGLVCMVYREVSHAKLPRSVGQLRRISRPVPLRDARSGDLVFFRGGLFGRINHVGIFLSGKTFIHASSHHGVRYDKLDEEYYSTHFVDIRRIFG
jgi:hypothetical protein